MEVVLEAFFFVGFSQMGGFARNEPWALVQSFYYRALFLLGGARHLQVRAAAMQTRLSNMLRPLSI